MALNTSTSGICIITSIFDKAAYRFAGFSAFQAKFIVLYIAI
jgi:hypothetical protein